MLNVHNTLIIVKFNKLFGVQSENNRNIETSVATACTVM